jgi:hemoglobin
MKKIEKRKDIANLVAHFYAKIRRDEFLGPIFNKHIKEEQWPLHLEKIADFWESNLFGVIKFKGNPIEKHIAVDKQSKHSIEMTHFAKWLQLWLESIDELFEGQIAEKAKHNARKMATGQYLAIWQHRKEEGII